MKNLRHFPGFLLAGRGVAALFGALRAAVSAPGRTTEARLGILFGAAALCLLLAVIALDLWRRWRHGKAKRLPLEIALALAYVAPALALLAPGWVELALRLPVQQLAPALLGGRGLSSGTPWFTLWNFVVLAGYVLLTRRSQIAAAFPVSGKPIRQAGWLVPSGLLGGIGLFLVAAFIFSLQTRAMEISLPALSPWQHLLLAMAGAMAAPWAVELVFRDELYARWLPRLGGRGAALAAAALYAALQFRPLLFFPAFILGLSLAWLARRSGSLLPAILAHASFNLLAAGLNWFLWM
ncbi:MAG: CPBP family intramembrane metalloprotease [Anaerolineaceae bacterium]|nr:CPBP family intramembrane metalloprotease [Anaerolineaceae bacterium]